MMFARRLEVLGQTIPRTRFASWPPLAAAVVLAVLATVIVYGLTLSLQSNPAPGKSAVAKSASSQDPISPQDPMSDVKLYKSIAARVAKGESYHAAAVAEQRAQGYPTHPIVTVRMPTLATIQARLGGTGAYVLLLGLVVAACSAWAVRLRTDLGPGRTSLYGSALMLIGLAPIFAPTCVYWHEAWAVALMALSLAVRTRETWGLAVCCGLAAVAIRELALPYLCLMAAMAAWQGNRREAAAWSGAIGVFLVAFALHAHAVAALIRPTDLASPGWSAAGGWRFVLQMMQTNTVLAAGNLAVAAVVVPFCLFGWCAWRSDVGLRTTLMLAGYACFFMLFGRPDNDYWGLLIGPFTFAGLIFVPGAIRDLVVAVLEFGRTRARKAPLPA